MHKSSRSVCVLILALVASGLGVLSPASAQQAVTPPAAAISETALLDQLRSGGLVLFMRHPQTEQSQNDVNLMKLDDCKTQRNLSEAGRTTSKAIGETMRHLKIPVGLVVTSEFCRAKEAAKLMGHDDAKVVAAMNMIYEKDGKVVVPAEDHQRRTVEVKTLLAAEPKAGTNTLLVSHRPNLEDAAGKEYIDVSEGEIVAFAPQKGEPAFKMVGRIKAARWSELAKTEGH